MSWNPRIDVWVIALTGAVAVVSATVLVWRSGTLGARWLRGVVWLLRLSAIAVLLAILANPVRNDVAGARGGETLNIVLVDTSGSMALERPESRFTRALRWSRAAAQAAPPGQTCRLAGFADDVKFDGEPALGGGTTRLAHALRRVVENDPGQRLANVVVVSDGRLHDRADLAAALALARQHHVAISTHTIGRDEPQMNVFLRACHVERSAPANTRVPLDVEIGATGLERDTELALTLKDASGAVLTSTPIFLHDGAAKKQLMLDSGLRTAAYTVALTRLDGELTYADNDFTFTLEIADPKIRVFYAEGSHSVHDVGEERWCAGRIMPAAFKRAGDIECDLFMMAEQDTRGLPLYRVRGFDEDERVLLDESQGIPRDREGWWKYDVVIISDIDRNTFSPAQMEWVRQLVGERGGGFCMIGGNQSFDTGSYEQTLWDKLIPVACLEFGFGHGWRGARPAFPKTVRNHPILRLAADPVLNDAILDCHPAFKGYHDIRRTKPGATTLARVAGKDAPLIAVQDYGRGRTMAFLSDAAGGWGDGGYQGYWGPQMLAEFLGEKSPDVAGKIDPASVPSNEFYNRFWVNSMRWLAEKSVRRQHQALVGRSEAITYRPGEIVKVAATVLNVFDPPELMKQAVGARLVIDGQERVRLTYDRDRKEFTGQLTLPEVIHGTEVAVVFDSVGAGASASDEIRLHVMQLDRELENPRPDPQLLADIAQAGGGAVLEEPGEVRAVFEKNQRETQTEMVPYSEPLWSEGWLWSALLAVLGAEWLVRRLAAA